MTSPGTATPAATKVELVVNFFFAPPH